MMKSTKTNFFFALLLTAIALSCVVISQKIIDFVNVDPELRHHAAQLGQSPQKTVTLTPDQVYQREKLLHAANLSYRVKGTRYYPKRRLDAFEEEGIASWYGDYFHGRLTTSGEPYNMHEMTAAHRTLPIPSYVRVTNLANQKSVVVRINDRGPFHGKRIIDLSYAAAAKLGFVDNGIAKVHIEQILSDDNDNYPIYLTLAHSDDFADASEKMRAINRSMPEFSSHNKLNLIRTAQGYDIRLGPLTDEEATEAASADTLFPPLNKDLT